MTFLEKLDALIKTYGKDRCGRRDNATLYGLCKETPPLAEHIIFDPMPDDLMQSMVACYRRKFPEELLILYKTLNGGIFFWDSMIYGKAKTRIAIHSLAIYGVPLTYDRKHIEPFNITVEDLNRPDGTPNTWLSFGSYYKPDDRSVRYDLFVDTDTNHVYAVEYGPKKCTISDDWDSIDCCLCYIFDMLQHYDSGKRGQQC